MLYVDGWMGLGWMVFIGHRSSKSIFGANNDPCWNPGCWEDGDAVLVQMEQKSWKGAKDVAEKFHFEKIKYYGFDWIICIQLSGISSTFTFHWQS